MLQRSRIRHSCLGLIWALLALLLLAFPALAAADLQTISFENAPPALNQPIEASAEAPKIIFLPNLGFRPYRAALGGGNAKDGQFVGDIGRCLDEAVALGRETGACEFAHPKTGAVLSETAGLVTLSAGTFSTAGEATLRAFDSEGVEVGHDGPKPVSRAQVRTEFSVQAPLGQDQLPANNIASFSFEGSGDLVIDAVTASFPGGGAPDFSISTDNQVIPIVQDDVASVPVHISRINGSTGAIKLSVEDLPEGVHMIESKEVTGSRATDVVGIPLEAEPGAPDTDFVPTRAKIVAVPVVQTAGRTLHNANFDIRVAQDFKLSSGEIDEGSTRKVLVQTPGCAPADVPLSIDRDIAMRRDVLLSLTDDEGNALPQGVSAEFLPSATVPPGGALRAERTLRLRAGPASEIGERPINLILRGADDPRNPPRTLELTMVPADEASVADGVPESAFRAAPMFMREGSLVRLHGRGFCAGTQVRVGNSFAATVPAKLADEHTLEFHVPRYATTGRVTVIPPGSLRSYQTTDRIAVDNGRDSAAFPFPNYGFGTLGIDEFTKAFGDDEVFIHVNPCWPFGDCSFSTGFLNPAAAVDWGWMNAFLHGTGGHCFGINLAIQRLESGKEPRRRYSDANASPNPHSAYEMSTESGPGPLLGDFLDAMHARQYSEEFMSARLDRDHSMQKQLSVLEHELSLGHEPMIVLEHGSTASHGVLAFDMERTATGSKIYVYDNEVPFNKDEEEVGAEHAKRVDRSTITISDVTNEWSLPTGGGGTWQGSGSDGSFWVVPSGAVPEDPSLPSLGTQLHSLTAMAGIGSSSGAVRADATSPGAEFMPTSEMGGPLGNGVIASDRPGPLRAAVEGVKTGRYTQTYNARDFAAAVSDVATAQGVHDLVTGSHDTIDLDSGIARPLEIEVARRESAAASTAATLETHASAHGSDTAGLGAGGALTYAHDGAPTTLRFSLTAVRRQGGPSTFLSPPVAVGRDAQLRVQPLGRDLRRVRLEVRDANGHRTTRVLHSRGGAPARLRIGKASASRRRVSVHYSVASLHEHAVVGVVLRLMRGHRVVARDAVSRLTANGARKFAWKPRRRLARGRYRLLVDLRLVSTGARGSTVSGSVSAHGMRAIVVR